MNFIQINVFLNVSETLNLSKTAQNLHMTQPAVTKNIQQLEGELSKKLFLRGKQGVTLTEAGEYFYQHMTDIMENIDQLVTHVKNHNYLSTFSLGYTNTPFEEKFLPQLLNEVSSKKNELNIILKNFNLNSGIDDLISRRLDLILTTSENVEGSSLIKFDPIFKSNFVALVPKESPLTTRKQLDINDLNDANIILFNPRQSPPAISKLQKELQLISKIGKDTIADTVAILITLVKGKQGVGILPDFVIDETDPDILAIPLNYSNKTTYGIAYLTENNGLEFNELIAMIKSIAKNEKKV